MEQLIKLSEGVELVRHNTDDSTLVINGGGQAMQSWERALMEESAIWLTSFGSKFLEAGLGFGYSALAIATQPNTASHLVIEKHESIIEQFSRRNQKPPNTLSIQCGDFFDAIFELAEESFDGIFFDPALPKRQWDDSEHWHRVVPQMRKLLRSGGALIPFFSTRPLLREQYLPYFDEVRVLKRRFKAFGDTAYTYGTEGDAYIQCFIK